MKLSVGDWPFKWARIAEKLAAFPILLYELTDRSLRVVSVTRKELEGELREVMRTVEMGDLETQMDTLRQFKLAPTLKIAAMELLDQLSIEQKRIVRRRTTVKALNDVSLSIMPQETIGIVGESGCGKSTLARVVLGLFQAQFLEGSCDVLVP